VPYLPKHWSGFEHFGGSAGGEGTVSGRWMAGQIALTLGMKCGVHRASFAGFGTTYSLTSSPHG
jgi:hypothetical protein